LTRRRFDEAEVLWLLLALLIKGLDGRRSVSTHDASKYRYELEPPTGSIFYKTNLPRFVFGALTKLVVFVCLLPEGREMRRCWVW
jgi:hypothetical protein